MWIDQDLVINLALGHYRIGFPVKIMEKIFGLSLLFLTACFDTSSKKDEEEEEDTNTNTEDTGTEDTGTENTGTEDTGDTGIDEDCSSDEMEDCTQECRPSAWFGDGNCDASLDCEELNFDDGDCDAETQGCGDSTATSVVVDVWGIQTSDIFDGSAWDIGGGLPDPFVCFYSYENLLFCSETADDTTEPDLSLTTSSITSAEGVLVIVVFDEDISSDDEMAQLELSFVALRDLVDCGEQQFNDISVSFSYEVRAE